VDSWNHAIARGKDEQRLEHQTVVLTVPASFDDVARTLTVDAARMAGLENLTLVEEPQAAFYCWLATHPPQEAALLKPGYRCLVVDVGGGTSDFSLIQAVEQQGELGFVRLAVGDHLLLGGDNMDLALAKFVETKLPGGTTGRLDAAQYGMLTQACREAKESLLGPGARRRSAAPALGCTKWVCPTSAIPASPGTWPASSNSTRTPPTAPRRRSYLTAASFNPPLYAIASWMSCATGSPRPRPSDLTTRSS
jgi:hypothetical protein